MHSLDARNLFLPAFLMVRAGKVVAPQRRAELLETSSDFKTIPQKSIHGLISLRL